MRRTGLTFILLIALTVILFLVDLAVGSVSLPLSDVVAALTDGDCPESTIRIVCDIRLIKAVVALCAGWGLCVSGLQMQTLFRNPLAGPYVLGVSSGASLAVALFIIGAPLLGISLSGAWGSLGIAGSALIGACIVLSIMAIAASRLKDIMVILILGMMLASGVSAIVQILQYLSDEDSLKSFVIWTMGSLGNVTGTQLPVLVTGVAAGLVVAVATIKPLNLLLLGEEYASTMGLNLRRSRMLIFLSTALLAGTTTAFCGPIGFIGLAIPHVTRLIFASADHRILIPGVALTGGAVMLVCDIMSKSFTLPINAITALVGIPMVVWIVLRNKSIAL